jgi:hypothetical protein
MSGSLSRPEPLDQPGKGGRWVFPTAPATVARSSRFERPRRRVRTSFRCRHYYGDEFFATARADTLTTTERLRAELAARQAAGTTDVVLYPASGGLEQVGLLADDLREAGFLTARNHG